MRIEKGRYGWRMAMRFDITCHTDTGICRKVNQDAACAMTAMAYGRPICMLVLCDGMGGASMGEYASRQVVLAFVDWFEQELPLLAEQEISLLGIQMVWMKKLIRLDEEFRRYGREHGIKLGTTATCMLFWKGNYLLVQSGDSRAYEIRWRKARQLTEDQSYVWQQVMRGNLTPEEAAVHPRRNVLTDCIGGSRQSVPAISMGTVKIGTVYLLCSDGLIHEVTKKELAVRLSPWKNGQITGVHESLVQMTELVKLRGETDNITAVGMYVATKRKWGKKGTFYMKQGEPVFLPMEKLTMYENSQETGETTGEENLGSWDE